MARTIYEADFRRDDIGEKKQITIGTWWKCAKFMSYCVAFPLVSDSLVVAYPLLLSLLRIKLHFFSCQVLF
jgi:hypothetical protein